MKRGESPRKQLQSMSQSQFSQNTANDDRTGAPSFNQAEYPNYEDDVGEHRINACAIELDCSVYTDSDL